MVLQRANKETQNLLLRHTSRNTLRKVWGVPCRNLQFWRN